MKIPFTEQAIQNAESYANKAGGYTHLHDGFKDTTATAQKSRWVTGGIAQNIVKDFCALNKIEAIEDTTDHTQNDKYDLIIQGFKFDVKATNNTIPCQVNLTSLKKATRGETDCFFFMRIDKNKRWYEPIGFCTSKYYSEHCTRIEKGDVIPGTSFVNKFNTTFVMSEDKMQYKGISSLSKLSYKSFETKATA